jgi:hypothetical protein
MTAPLYPNRFAAVHATRLAGATATKPNQTRAIPAAPPLAIHILKTPAEYLEDMAQIQVDIAVKRIIAA